MLTGHGCSTDATAWRKQVPLACCALEAATSRSRAWIGHARISLSLSQPIPDRRRKRSLMRNVGPCVAVFGLGGTIAMTRSSDGGVSPALSAQELLAAVP